MSIVDKTYKNGEIIIKEGDSGNSFFRLLEGKAYVFSDYEKKDQLQLTVLEEGEYFGEMSILEDYPRSATIIAKGGAKVLEILSDDMGDYFEDHPDQLFELMKHLGNRVQSMENDYNDAKALLAKLLGRVVHPQQAHSHVERDRRIVRVNLVGMGQQLIEGVEVVCQFLFLRFYEDVLRLALVGKRDALCRRFLLARNSCQRRQQDDQYRNNLFHRFFVCR